MRVLGLDYGRVRVGVALSDPTGTIAQVLEVIPHRGFAQVSARIRELVSAHQVDRIVLGLPRSLDGRERDEAAAVRSFARKLQSVLSMPVEFADERLSTAAAERALVSANERRARRRRVRDAVAAALILQTYLDRHRGTRQAPDEGEDER